MEDLSAFSARPRLAALLNHFAGIADTRQSWKVMYPLREVLFLVVCGTIASGDDYDDIRHAIVSPQSTTAASLPKPAVS
jgi:hypothetical protein